MSVTAAAGFRAAGATAGLKPSGAPDVSVVVNDGPSHSAAGVFTRNTIVAAPVRWSRQVLTSGSLGAVVLNSGGANACTGPQGFADTHHTAEHAAERLGLGAAEVAVCSTGLIGRFLDMPRLTAGIDVAVGQLASTDDAGAAAAEAIRTTDTRAKQAIAQGGAAQGGSAHGGAAEGGHPGVPYRIGGMAKGAGMLAPALATMLVVITTDADLSPADCDKALRAATALTFERLDTDGCLSTNDTVLLLASGVAGRPDPDEFTATLTGLCRDLAMQLLADAEGAAHEIAITVRGAPSEQDAVTVGRQIARSNLLKCAVFGRDPNWGRVIAAAGATDVTFDPDRIDVAINGVQVCRGGAPGADPDEVDLAPRAVTIDVDLAAGPGSATIWTSDLTHDYVHENSAYST